MTDLSDIPIGELHAELRRREETVANDRRLAIRERYGVCKQEVVVYDKIRKCGAEFVEGEFVRGRPIDCCGIYGHEPGRYGYEGRFRFRCRAGHDTSRPLVEWFDKPMPF
jgi:hypothetical protein